MATEFMVSVFWTAVAFVAYTLVGYPTLLWIRSLLWPRHHRRAENIPTVTVIVVVHNAAAIITDKLKNTLAFDYPRDKLDIIIGSDGSTDETPQIVRQFARQGVKLVESRTWIGKHHVQMVARDVAQGEILVFTDASIHVRPDVLRKMVSHFVDGSIGCVCSADEMSQNNKSWMGETIYVYGEMGLRRLESKVNSLVSLSGSLFAVRKSLCEEWHPDMSSDFFLALHAVARRLRSVLDPECQAHVGVVGSERAELSRKVRTIVHGLAVFFSHLELLNPLRYGFFSWQLASHKLFRWLLPFAFLAALVSNCFLWAAGPFYQFALIAQLVGYGSGLLANTGGAFARIGPFRLANFFLMGNIATLLAWWKLCRGEKIVTWEPSRRG